MSEVIPLLRPIYLHSVDRDNFIFAGNFKTEEDVRGKYKNGRQENIRMILEFLSSVIKTAGQSVTWQVVSYLLPNSLCPGVESMLLLYLICWERKLCVGKAATISRASVHQDPTRVPNGS
jgi:hypothetical protein